MRSPGHKKLETTEIDMAKFFAKERHAIHQTLNKFGIYIIEEISKGCPYKAAFLFSI